MNITKVLIIIVFIAISSSAYTNCTDHKIFVHAMKQQVDSTSAKENKKNREYVYKKLQEIIQNNVNLKEISRFVMGKHWILTTQKERENFLREYEVYLMRLCAKILYKYMNGSEMIIMSSRAADDETCLISTRFSYGDEEFTNIDFKVTKNNSSFLISDVVMNGISISINQRSQFSEKIDMDGIASVIDELKCNNNL
ncbi:phospholipid-binding protein MlaC [Wolbachia endosymbiont of Cantharis cryptica]|uniref:MlaC/ttg2D family ABC transporter substrate-binding protein n=1 Tax=Wolbachia endosymbiont of Cantharis cryptica TaxID=3066132 RepID=UPI00376ECEDA